MWAHTTVFAAAIRILDGPIIKMLQCMQWAHARPSAQELTSHLGPTPLSQKVTAHLYQWAHVSILLGSCSASCKLCGPMRQSW